MPASFLSHRSAAEDRPPLFPPAFDPVSAVWQWQSDDGWHCFSPSHCEALETARINGGLDVSSCTEGVR